MRLLGKKIRGFTLFEAMLALFIVSLLSVSVYQYLNRKAELTAEQEYGEKLFTFGSAVRAYVFNDPNLYTNGTLPGTTVQRAGNIVTLTGQGVNWVKQAVNPHTAQPYLDNNFSFNTGIAPLILAKPDPQGAATSTRGDNAIQTVITFDITQPNIAPSISVTAPVLYQQSGGKTVIRPDLTTDAIQHANNLYDPTRGVASINYTAAYLAGGTGGLDLGASISGQLSAVAAVTSYLKIDGSNNMIAPLNFAATDKTKNQITGLKTLNFDGVSADLITQLNTLSFVNNQTGTIGGFTSLNFDGSASASINNLNNLYMGPDMVSNSGGVIKNLTYTPEFKGIRYATGKIVLVNGYTVDINFNRSYLYPTWFNSVFTTNLDPATSLCVLTQVVSSPDKGGCKLFIDTVALVGYRWAFTYTETNSDSTCEATCITWD